MHMPKKHGQMKHAGPPPQVHAPDVQPSAVSPHALPQEPQWLTVTFVLMQVPLQQLSVDGQTRPQAPQFATSLPLTLVHVPSQQDWVAPQAAPVPHLHTPPTQLSPALHAGSQGTSSVHVPDTHVRSPSQTMPHPPQLFGSVSVLMHAPPQHPVPAPQGSPPPHLQAPSTQVSPAAHAGVHSGS